MRCPYCEESETEVIETRFCEDLDTLRRRRSCLKCTRRFTTYERVENIALTVVKKDGRRERFNIDKLRSGILRACEKTTVSASEIDKILAEVWRELRSGGSAEIISSTIGEMVATRLKNIDQVAYIRFSSVFKHFVDAEDFEKEVQRLINNN